MAEKVTAGRDQLGQFAPKFAQLNDDVLFGEVWAREEELSTRDRCIVTVTALMASGVLDSSPAVPHPQRQEPRGHRPGDGGDPHPRGLLCRLAQGLGRLPDGQGSLRRIKENTIC